MDRPRTLKKAESVRERIGRLSESYGGEVRHFKAEVVPGGNGHGKPAGIAWRKLEIPGSKAEAPESPAS
ncbi:MAG: hypothetical protein LBT40_03445 [Deltaproteobacteria bacterium]|nr:hypothetical protein [Deltaproteobacteria bacterium]